MNRGAGGEHGLLETVSQGEVLVRVTQGEACARMQDAGEAELLGIGHRATVQFGLAHAVVHGVEEDLLLDLGVEVLGQVLEVRVDPARERGGLAVREDDVGLLYVLLEHSEVGHVVVPGEVVLHPADVEPQTARVDGQGALLVVRVRVGQAHGLETDHVLPFERLAVGHLLHLRVVAEVQVLAVDALKTGELFVVEVLRVSARDDDDRSALVLAVRVRRNGAVPAVRGVEERLMEQRMDVPLVVVLPVVDVDGADVQQALADALHQSADGGAHIHGHDVLHALGLDHVRRFIVVLVLGVGGCGTKHMPVNRTNGVRHREAFSLVRNLVVWLRCSEDLL